MKQLFLFGVLFVCCFCAYGQSIDIDIRRDWYAETSGIDLSIIDTMMLYPVMGNVNSKKDVFIWRNTPDKDFTLEIYNNTQPGITDPYVYAPEKWKIKGDDEKELYLVIKDHRQEKMFHNKIGRYRMYPYRSDHNILYKIMLVREYSNRYGQLDKAPNVR